MACLFATVFKRSTNLDMESENDHEDDGKSLNKYFKFKNYKHVSKSVKSFKYSPGSINWDPFYGQCNYI